MTLPFKFTPKRVVIALLGLLAATYFLRDTSLRFTEEVQLASGAVIEVERHIKTKSFGELGGPGGWESLYNGLTVTRAYGMSKPPIWFSDTGLIPMVLDRDPQSDQWFLVATFYSCQAWYDLGRPKLPYVEFRLVNGQWRTVPLSPELFGRPANVMTGVRSGGEPKLLRLIEKQERNRNPMIGPKYKKIINNWKTSC